MRSGGGENREEEKAGRQKEGERESGRAFQKSRPLPNGRLPHANNKNTKTCSHHTDHRVCDSFMEVLLKTSPQSRLTAL